MATIQMRFDLRVAPFAQTTFAAQYGACLDMAAWGEGIGARSISVSEHHGDPAGFTPAPITLAAAILARTRRVAVSVSAASDRPPPRYAHSPRMPARRGYLG